ncbi:MAG TPA: tetratricopeptide repeat protein [Polyangiaceae bacterium]|nr:tetratricopeptide repeat protein [Polyangiaceae bacterium]
MSGLDLHPEDLLDKFADRTLSEAEAARLDAHLAMCSVCRVELQLRADFEEESELLRPNAPLQLTPLPAVARGIAAPLSATAPLQGSASPHAGPASAASNQERAVRDERSAMGESKQTVRRRRPLAARRLAWVAAALLSLVASVSLAARYTGWFESRGAANRPILNSNLQGTGARGHGPRSASKAEQPTVMPTPSSAIEASPGREGSVTVPSASSALDQAAGGESPSGVRVVRPSVVSNRSVPNRPVSDPAPLRTPQRRGERSATVETSNRAPAANGGSPHSAALENVEADASALFREANAARRGGNAVLAIELYRRLQRVYPASPEAELSRATLAALLLEQGEPAAALDSFDKYLQRGGKLVDAEALVGRALALSKLGKRDEEIAAWRAVLSKFPGTVYAEQATKRLTALGER